MFSFTTKYTHSFLKSFEIENQLAQFPNLFEDFLIFIFLLTRIITLITAILQSLYCVLIFTLSLFFRFLSRIF